MRPVPSYVQARRRRAAVLLKVVRWRSAMSALGQERTSRQGRAMSALPLKADMDQRFKRMGSPDTARHVNESKQRAMAQFRRVLMPTMSATRVVPARCHLTCTTVPTLTSHHEPSRPTDHEPGLVGDLVCMSLFGSARTSRTLLIHVRYWR